jgi:cell division septum initiation protein DivIVA
MLRIVLLLSALVFLSARPASAQLDQILKEVETYSKSGAALSGNEKIGAALKQALQVGTENAVKLTGKTDGYFTNQAIKILMPEKLRTVETGLRAVGYGADVDNLVLSMNRAAERAAPEAKKIFSDAIGKMTIDDAQRILNGAPTAATDYFKDKTSASLTETFRPVVNRTMGEVGALKQYNDLLGQAKTIPFLKTESVDLDRYVVGKALDGLFHVVGEEEKKIRTDPAARVTSLMKEVFAK